MPMKRGPKKGKAAGRVPAVSGPSGLGDCPAELAGLGRQLWLDAVAHLEATGRADTVHRTALRIACLLVDTVETDPGITRSDCCRRWLHELGFTPTTSGTGATEAPATHEASHSGRAKVLALIARKHASA